MNDVYGPLAMGWGLLNGTDSSAARQAREARRDDLHRKAVARRRKAKRGGKR